MKKYKLFYGTNHHPHGGWEDFKGSFDSEQAAKEFLENQEAVPYTMWAHIVYRDKIIRYAYVFKDKPWTWRDEE